MPPRGDEDKIERLRGAMYSRKYGDRIGERERRALEHEAPAVPEDWSHDDAAGKTVLPLDQFATMQRPAAPRILKWILGISAIFFLGAILFFVYYLFLGTSATSSRNIDINITGPSQMPGGELADLEITITNHNSQELDLADLVVTYPPGTRLNADSCTGETCRITLGTIAAGASTAVKLPAIYEGGAGQHADVQAELEYHLPNSSAIFVASSDYPFVFSSSPLSINVTGNTQTISGQPMQMTVTVSSNADQPIDDVVLSDSAPFGFKTTSATPAADGNGLWDIGVINPGESKTITINGVLSGDVTESHVFHFTAGTQTSATSTSVDAPLADTSLAISIAQPFLNLGISVGDAASGQTVNVAPGDIVNVAITYDNNLSTEIDNATVVARLSGITIDGQSIHTPDGFYRSTDNSVLWDKTTEPTLASLAAGAQGTLRFTFQMPATADLEGIQNPILDVSVSAAGQRVGETNVPQNLQSTADQKIAVASDLQIASQGLYFTDPFGATGPMPPMAGTETTYAVVLSVTNTTNEIDGGVVTAQLPPYVRLVGNHYLPASEKVSFDSTTGTFTWNVGTIAPSVGLNGSAPRQVVIEVGFTPSTSQIGTSPTLVQSIALKGTDTSTGQAVEKDAPDVTTNIVGDPGFESINSKVVAPQP